MIYSRLLNLFELLKKKSFFLFGPRATGKSFLIKQQFDRAVPVFDLLRSDLYLRLSSKPWELESMISAYQYPEYVILDEIQRIPMLLNEVHRLIEEKHWHFLLTGSSARKLRRGQVNLLGGRAWEAHIFPLTSQEIPQFDLQRYLLWGGLPPIYSSSAPEEELFAYVNTYLKEEIQAEALVRKIPSFSRFLQVSALTSGCVLNFTGIANDTGIPVSTIREYYQVLEDTFIGFLVAPWQKSIKRKPISTSKFYFFDLGVKNILAEIKYLDSQSDLFGQAFEHFIGLELYAYINYRRLHLPLCFWQTKHGHEVDFIIGDKVAIEVKATHQVGAKHLKGLTYLSEEKVCDKYFLISQDKVKRKVDNIMLLPWDEFLELLWSDKII